MATANSNIEIAMTTPMTTTTFLCPCTLQAWRSITIKWLMTFRMLRKLHQTLSARCSELPTSIKQEGKWCKQSQSQSQAHRSEITNASKMQNNWVLARKQWIFWLPLSGQIWQRGVFFSVCSTLLHIEFLVVLSVAFLSSVAFALKH